MDANVGMPNFQRISLPTFSDVRGTLTVQEGVLPFQVVRSYWIYGAAGQLRGGHRHRHTRQALVAVHGRVDIYLCNGRAEETVILANPGTCLLVEPEDWHTMYFHENAVLLVMSSHGYDRSEYIDAPYDRLA